MSTYKSIASARAKQSSVGSGKSTATNPAIKDLSADTRYPLRTRICFLLEIDPLSSSDELQDAIRKVVDECGVLRSRVFEAERQLAYAMPHVHTKGNNDHDNTPWWHKCQHWQCKQAAALLSSAKTIDAKLSPEPMSDSDFYLLWNKINTQTASAIEINLYRAEIDRRHEAHDTSVSGKDEREGKNSEEKK